MIMKYNDNDNDNKMITITTTIMIMIMILNVLASENETVKRKYSKQLNNEGIIGHRADGGGRGKFYCRLTRTMLD